MPCAASSLTLMHVAPGKSYVSRGADRAPCSSSRRAPIESSSSVVMPGSAASSICWSTYETILPMRLSAATSSCVSMVMRSPVRGSQLPACQGSLQGHADAPPVHLAFDVRGHGRKLPIEKAANPDDRVEVLRLRVMNHGTQDFEYGLLAGVFFWKLSDVGVFRVLIRAVALAVCRRLRARIGVDVRSENGLGLGRTQDRIQRQKNRAVRRRAGREAAGACVCFRGALHGGRCDGEGSVQRHCRRLVAGLAVEARGIVRRLLVKGSPDVDDCVLPASTRV